MKLTVADFIVRYIDNQYIEIDGKEAKFVEGIFTIFGHGNVLGIGQSLEDLEHELNVIQGKNEQGMALSAMGFAKERKRQSIYAVTTSIGPGCTNLVTAAACATINRIPMLLFPGDSFESRKPDPVLQQLENINSNGITVSDCLKPVSKYYDRITHPDQIISTLNKAFSVLTNPETTGAVTIALPQDIQCEIIECEENQLMKQIWKVKRKVPSSAEIDFLVSEIKSRKKIIFLCGGGVKYSDAGRELEKLSNKLNVPIVETQSGKSACSQTSLNLGGVGVTGTLAANEAVKECELIINFGSRLNDFTSQSASFAKNKKLINVNIDQFDKYKQCGSPVDADIRLVVEELNKRLNRKNMKINNFYAPHIKKWAEIREKLQSNGNIIGEDGEQHINQFSKLYSTALNQTQVVMALNEIIEEDAIIITASGSLPGDLERLWSSKSRDSYHVEYGYSCMGYEINSAIGVKLANPELPVYVFVGDGSFNMLHSEILTSLQYDIPINILLFDNSGFGCINNLQKEYGSKGYRTEFKKIEKNNETKFIGANYAQIARGYGAESVTIKTMSDIKTVKGSFKTKLYDIKVSPKTMTNGYSSWWDVGFNRVIKNEKQNSAYMQLRKERDKRDRTSACEKE